MLKKTTLFVYNLLFFSGIIHAQSVQNFSVSPQKAFAGQQMNVVYNPKSTILEGKRKISATVYQFIDYNWKKKEIEMDKSDSLWTAQFTPDSAAAIVAFKFKSGKQYDIGHGYGWMLLGKDSVNIAGSYAGWAFLRNPTVKEMDPGYTDGKALIGDDVVSYWMTQQVLRAPQSKRDIFYYALQVLKKNDPAKAKIAAFEDISYINNFPERSMKDLINIRNVYANILNDKIKADSVSKIISSIDSAVIRANNPSKLAAYKAIGQERDYKKLLEKYIDFLNQYPMNMADTKFDKENYIDYNRIYGSIGTIASVAKDTTIYKKYVAIAPFASLSTIYYRSVSVPYVSLKTIDAAQAYIYARPIIARMMEFNTVKPQGFMDVYFDAIPTFADILMHLNKDEAALGFATSAQQKYQYGKSTLNEVQSVLLKRMGQKEKLKAVLEASTKKNQVSPLMLDMLKEVFIAENRSAEGFEAYLTKLKSGDIEKQLAAKVKSSMISQRVPDFTLMDNFGKQVTLSAQKGKVVVIDFWASWCAPCKAAFPGMKMVKDRYTKADDIVFFFIDTQEKMKDYQGYVKKYLADNGFDFHVLFDADAKMSKAFKVSAIPHKMVIGKDGMLLFSEVGYMGSPSELADEMGLMIETAREAATGK
ncbi:TlpA family protein disulfide reductase [Pedobacter agri]|uniref:TlpA family protein disulfide reductase n=1 Tax=Pedobacter agri TaxID=454586 RepID=UPI00292D5705|nr:TlpA disulfide reductase family protein [Pedobacter agri]